MVLTNLQLQPAIIDPDSTQLQIFELRWKPIGPSHRTIEQLVSKQLLKFAFEECAENDAPGPLLHFSGKLDIEVSLTLKLDRAVGLHKLVRRLDRRGVWQRLVFFLKPLGADSEFDQIVVEDRFDRLKIVESNRPRSILLLARNPFGKIAELGRISVHLLTA